MPLPSFLGIGAQRSGTSWLDRQLRSHPEIFLPHCRKEVHFFDDYYHRGLDWYTRFFPTDNEAAQYRALGEITPRYMFAEQAPARIREVLPNCKLIAVLRNPVDRAYSQYGHSVKNQAETRPFEQYFEQRPDAFQRGLYCEQLERFLALFSRENLLVLIFEHAVLGNPQRTFGQIGEFLDVDPGRFQTGSPSRRIGNSYTCYFPKMRASARRLAGYLREKDLDWLVNVAKSAGVPKMFGNRGPLPPMNAETRSRLLEQYRPSIEKLEQLLDEDLSIWKESQPSSQVNSRAPCRLARASSRSLLHE